MVKNFFQHQFNEATTCNLI